uniref:Uncharacterized protein n=1 Tax=Rhizophora mucronata TaxID=61149 RepID=A0A2P2PRR0_RHIMU
MAIISIKIMNQKQTRKLLSHLGHGSQMPLVNPNTTGETKNEHYKKLECYLLEVVILYNLHFSGMQYHICCSKWLTVRASKISLPH